MRVSMTRHTWILILLIVLVGLASLFIGSANIFTMDVSLIQSIIIDIRLPRVLMAMVVGVALVMSGWVLQVVLRNPMADSFTLGMANAAILGSALTVALGLPVFLQPFLSVIFGFISLSIVVILSYTMDRRFANETLIINGILIGALWSGALYLVILMNPDKTASIAQYMFGSFATARFSLVLMLSILTIVALVIILRKHQSIDYLNLGDVRAHSLGVNPSKLRPFLIVVASIPPLVAISYTGMIAIVGIIIPQLILYLRPMRFKAVMIFSILYGAMFMIVVDTIGRTIIAPIQIPTGVMVMLSSVPILLFLMRKRLFRV